MAGSGCAVSIGPRGRWLWRSRAPCTARTQVRLLLVVDSPAIGAQLGRWFDDASSPEASFRPELTEPGIAAAPLARIGSDDAGQPQRYTREPLASW